MAATAKPRLRDLPDVDRDSFADGDVPIWDDALKKFVGGSAGGPESDPVASAALTAHAAVQGNGAHLPSGGVAAGQVAGSLKPSGSAAAGDEALRALGHGATQALPGDEPLLPSTGQKNALAGTAGTPGSGNEYATKQTSDALDARVTVNERGGVAKAWAASTAYKAGQVVIAPDGTPQVAKTDFTSGGSFDQTNWMPLLARKVLPPPRVCITWDDTHIAGWGVGLDTVEQYGGRGSLMIQTDQIDVSGRMRTPEVLDAYQRGHELVSHSVSHADMTTLNTATRPAEWDNSKAAIEAIVGAGAVKSWCYPSSAWSVGTDREAWGRYQHVLSGVAEQYLFNSDQLHTFKIGRWAWNDGNHAATLALLDALTAGQVLVLYTHKLGGSSLSNSVTTAEFLALVQKCAALGIEMVTVQQAFGDFTPVMDIGMEDPTLAAYMDIGTLSSATVSQATGQTIAGLKATTAQKISRTVTTAGNAVRAQKKRVPVTPGVAYTLSAKLKYLNRTGGTGGADIAIVEFDADYTVIGTFSSTLQTANVATYTQQSVARTAASNARFHEIRLRLQDADGDAYFTHVHHGPTAGGVLG